MKPLEVRERAMALVREGRNYKEVGMLVGVSPSTVRIWAGKKGLITVCDLPTDLKRSIRKMMMAGVSDYAIAREHRIASSLIETMRRRGFGFKAAEDLAGKQFGHWTVLERSGYHTKSCSSYWLCECGGCGKTKVVRRKDLMGGRSKSCARCAQRFYSLRVRKAKTPKELASKWAQKRERQRLYERTRRERKAERQGRAA